MDSENRSNRFDKSRGGDVPPSQRLYLSFLPQDIEEFDLRDLFGQVGVVERVKIIKKDDGFTLAFVNMSSVEEAQAAIQKFQRYKMGEKMIRVQFARERRQDDKSSQKSRDRGGFKEDFQRQSDARKRFEGGSERGRGRGFGRDDGNRGDRGGDRFERDNRQDYQERGRGGNDRFGGQDNFRDQRKPMKCFKCQEEGHISKNCPGEQTNYSSYNRTQQPKKVQKMSQDEFSDY